MLTGLYTSDRNLEKGASSVMIPPSLELITNESKSFFFSMRGGLSYGMNRCAIMDEDTYHKTLHGHRFNPLWQWRRMYERFVNHTRIWLFLPIDVQKRTNNVARQLCQLSRCDHLRVGTKTKKLFWETAATIQYEEGTVHIRHNTVP